MLPNLRKFVMIAKLNRVKLKLMTTQSEDDSMPGVVADGGMTLYLLGKDIKNFEKLTFTPWKN